MIDAHAIYSQAAMGLAFGLALIFFVLSLPQKKKGKKL